MAITHPARGGTGGTHEFLMGWGGTLAVGLGIATAFALSPLTREIVHFADRAMRSAGMSSESAVLALYWFQAIAIGVGFAIVFAGPNARINGLRTGIGDWNTVIREALITAGTVSLWVAANWIWDAFVDEFNAYGNATELPVMGVMVAIPVVAVIVSRAMRRRA